MEVAWGGEGAQGGNEIASTSEDSEAPDTGIDLSDVGVAKESDTSSTTIPEDEADQTLPIRQRRISDIFRMNLDYLRKLTSPPREGKVHRIKVGPKVVEDHAEQAFPLEIVSIFVDKTPHHISSSAWSIYKLIGESAPPPNGSRGSPKKIRKSRPMTVPAPIALVEQKEPAIAVEKINARASTTTHTHGGKTPRQPKAVPQVSSKVLKRLKAQLVKPDAATKIICDLKRIETPSSSIQGGSVGATHIPNVKVYTLPAFVGDSAQVADNKNTIIIGEQAEEDGNSAMKGELSTSPAFALLTMPSPGALAGMAMNQSGAFELLADTSGTIVHKSGVQGGLTAPFNRPAVFIYWWGYEISLPPPSLKSLGSVHSVSSTVFNFLSAVTLAGGAPELAPFVRYLSTYCDMEWGAIKAQNHGHGVVLAATWLLPVAIIPRPWDFPLP